MLKASLIFCSFVLTHFAANAQQDNIFTDEDFGKPEFQLVSKDLSAAFVHTNNTGGSSLGSIWGVEAGIVAGILEAKNLQNVARDITGEDQDDLKYLPYAGVIAGVALPFGIGGEVSLVPETDLGDGSFSNLSMSLRWSITDIIPIVGSFSPLKITARASHGTTEMNYSFSTSGNSTETADFKIDNTEFGVVAGFNLFLIEPYVGLGRIKADSVLNAETTATFPGLINKRTLRASPSGTRSVVGVLLKLPLLRFGLEASRLHSETRYTFKMSLKI